MKKFIINILFFSLLTLAGFQILDYFIAKSLRNSTSSFYDTYTKIHKQKFNNLDLIINGSSKAYLQISPKVIDSILELNSYNFGREGSKFDTQLFSYELYRKYNNKPKYLIQIVSHETFSTYSELYRYILFAPYLELSEVRKLTAKYQSFNFIDYHIPLLKYSGILTDKIFVFGNKKDIYKGYFPQKERVWDTSFNKFKKANPNGITINLDKEMLTDFEEYIKKNKEDSIQVFMVYPPTYYEAHSYIKNRDEIIQIYKNISEKYNISFLNYSSDSISLNRDYFYNSQHLNENGAELFTLKMSRDIKKILNEGNTDN